MIRLSNLPSNTFSPPPQTQPPHTLTTALSMMLHSITLACIVACGLANPLPAGKTIVDIAVATPDLSTLVTALTAGDLVTTLSGPGPFTVFAPSNEAFAKLPPLYLKLLLDPANIKTLQKVLTYHVAFAAAFSKDLTNGETIATVEGEAVTVTLTKRVFKPTVVMINNSTVTTADVAASNGVVHIIDTVLMPPDMPPPTADTIVELAQGVADLSTLVTALKAADLVSTLSSPGPFTVFAPSNEAFAKLPAGVLAKLLEPRNKAQLVKLLTYHVIAGAAIAKKDLRIGYTTPAASVEGDELKIFRPCTNRKCNMGSRIFIGPYQNASQCANGGNYKSCYEAFATSLDNVASNGVVHIIDSVLSLPNHLYFRTLNGKQQCGEVDAAPRMPESLFEPSNAANLKEYADITVALYGPVKLAVGRCAAIGYNVSLGPAPLGAVWAPPSLMGPVCLRQCKCIYPGFRAGEALAPWLPQCVDQPDDPAAGTFCSLCGPKFNSVIGINLFKQSSTAAAALE